LKKLQQFFVYKISTSRLKRSNYSISITTEQARKSGELVSLGDSQMLRSLRQLKGQVTNEEEIAQLLEEKRKIKNRRHNYENSQRLIEIDERLDACLFVPEIISVLVEDIRDYKYIGQNGFKCNGVTFHRFICGAGQARRNNSLWIAETVDKDLRRILNNDRKDIEITPAKFSAYFSLASSASLEVTTPYFCVVPDCEIVRKERVDFVREVENGDDIVEECDKDLTFSLWDGMGLISPRFAMQWVEDLGLDYIPSTFIIRSSFLKGMLATFDFVEFSDEIGEHYITDVWGNRQNIRDQDIIISQSQFKLFEAYDSIEDYVSKCKINNLGWGVTRVSPKFEDTHCFTNYQFDQILNLNDDQIENFCGKTVEYFGNILKNDVNYTLLYLLGEEANRPFDENAFDDIHDNVTKALILNNKLLDDPYIKNHILHSLNKKIRESYIGNLLIDGQYTMMVNDPFAFMENLFHLPVIGLLKRDEYYSRFWLEKGEGSIVGMRAPLTWRSEAVKMVLKDDSRLQKYFKYLDKCLVLNVHGVDHAKLGGSDVDGDIICLTNCKEILDGIYGGLPVVYDTKKAPKCKIDESQLYLWDIKGFNSKVGWITNVATSTFALLPKFEESSYEYEELIKHLKCFRKEQGVCIDSTKGLITKPFPIHWTRRKKVPTNATQEEIDAIEFHDRIVVDKRPIFMRWLYGHYNRQYLSYFDGKNEYCDGTFDKKLQDLIDQYHIDKSKLSEDEQKYIDDFYRYSPYLETDCIVNKISNHMQSKIKEIKTELKGDISPDIIAILKNPLIPFDKEKYKLLDGLYHIYKSGKRKFMKQNVSGETKFKNIEQYNKYIRQGTHFISTNLSELVNLAVKICYEDNPKDGKQFLWDIFGDGVIENIAINRQELLNMPFADNSGEIEYLGGRYSMREVILKNESKAEDLYIYEDFE
jgi:hypothetical protein